MIIREFKIEDLNEVAELLNAYRMFYKKDSDIDACKSFLEERYHNHQSKIFVAEETNIIGFVQIYPIFSTVSLQRAYILNDLYVSSSNRSSGAGQKLIEKTFEYAKENNAKYICLETGQNNINAQNLYKKMGMEVDESVYHFSKGF
ncbi:GNAT family N-acetyltransferase [Macrococcus equipercicus]|uniref:GNAT family N-acetyltransferase n=1 Tax=Macrococcus equipercicus TaxID=69967 RepID=A0ABQ6R9I8_9STAP|nr:GNAT family N-acetyltransferase [Macrococcus equipercicus]KAA1039932.1 GNAT family N-acetyltransferase [Macrococcus equipercicus]